MGSYGYPFITQTTVEDGTEPVLETPTWKVVDGRGVPDSITGKTYYASSASGSYNELRTPRPFENRKVKIYIGNPNE